MSAAVPHGQTPYYFVPAPSRHPVLAAIGLLLVVFGASQWVNGYGWGAYAVLVGLVFWAFVLQQWFRQAIGESEGGLYGDRIDISYRWSMSWFIFSEVMFFAAFFGALYWTRLHALPNLGSFENAILWPDFKAVWPSAGGGYTGAPAGAVEPFGTMGPWPLPTINTMLLLTSGVTLTVAHHALIAAHRARAIAFMWVTVLLGITFLCVQGYEYSHAYSELNLKLSSGAYGSTFFMLTGFHGFHVFVGMLMLLFITLRLMKGHFTPQRHFGFEGAAWYWHFVDVVWLGLYIVVYWMWARGMHVAVDGVRRFVAMWKAPGAVGPFALARRRFAGGADVLSAWRRLAVPLYTRCAPDADAHARVRWNAETTAWFNRPDGDLIAAADAAALPC